MGQGKRYEHADQRYLQDIGRYELLDAEREKELGRKSQEGDLSARNELVEHNLRLVVSIASRYQGYGLELDDLIQSGNLGLMTAAERYDPDRGFRFTTFAVHWICQYIRREISDTGRAIRLPVYMTEKIHAMKKAESDHSSRITVNEMIEGIEPFTSRVLPTGDFGCCGTTVDR